MKFNILVAKATFLSLIILFVAKGYAQNPVVYLDPAASVDERVEDLLSRMTLAEKIGQMTQINVDKINLRPNNYAFIDTNKAREAIQKYHIGSFLNGFAIPAQDWYNFTHKLQEINLEESRLRIPLLYGIDHMHGASYVSNATYFPQNINLGNTFNTEFARIMGSVTTLESAHLGHNWIFGPVLDIGRDPRWPRFYETYGEDPLLVSRMGAAYVKALQSEEGVAPYRAAATAKHFIGYSTPFSGWDRSPVLLPMQNLHEFHRPGFQAAIDAGIKTVMVNSGEVNGIPVHASYDILENLLRKEMGFKGVVLTDWADIIKLTAYDRVGYQQEHYHRVAIDEKEATRKAILAGIDISMTPMSFDFVKHMHDLVEEGHITEERIDASVRRILRLKFELGLFEAPLPTNTHFDLIGHSKHMDYALAAAEESVVLLKNENNLLPLSQRVRNILLVGDKAQSKKALNGGWTIEWQGGNDDQYPESMKTILDAFRATYPAGNVSFVASPGALGSSQRRDFDRAASRADFIFVVAGEMPYTEFIGNIVDLTIDRDQLDLIDAVQKTGKPHGVILLQGRPRVLTSLIDQTPVVIFGGLPGGRGAEAIVNIISGKTNPSGRLGFTYPKYPSHFNTYDHKPTDRATAQWVFGHGLSYTSFEYTNLRLSSDVVLADGSITATVDIKNTGSRTGKHTAMWFLTDEIGTITRPVKKLAHFEKFELSPGESVTAEFVIRPGESLWYPDETGNKILEAGRFILRIGELEADFHLK